jgi:hypothetical protein
MRKLSLTLILIGMFAAVASAQERETTMAELSPKIVKSTAILASGPYKSVAETERFDKKGGKSLEKTRITQDVVSTSKMRSFNEYLSDKSRPSVEHINLDGIKYERIAGQDWKLITRVFTVVDSAAGSGNYADRIPIQSKQVNKFFFVGNAEVSGQKAAVYEIRTVVARTYSSGETAESRTNMRYWFGENGALLSRSSETNDPRNGIYGVTTIWFTYGNTNVNIEAPILGPVN